jgi:hypothetical protein
MIMVAYQLFDWLRRNNIDPEDVTIRLECDDKVGYHIGTALRADIDRSQLETVHRGTWHGGISHIILHGIKIRIN